MAQHFSGIRKKIMQNPISRDNFVWEKKGEIRHSQMKENKETFSPADLL